MRSRSKLANVVVETAWISASLRRIFIGVPTDSGAFRSQFCGREIVNAVLIVGGVAFEEAARTAHHTPREPRPSVTRRHRLALQTIENHVRPSERIGQFMN